MAVVVLGCKAVIAVLLLAAGGAKVADLPGFAASVRLFAPRGTAPSMLRAAALWTALGEIAAGAASLSDPQIGWLNLVVLAICCAFLVVSVVGYARHPGRPCRCFGALSSRAFTWAGIARAGVLVLGAAVATAPVRALLVGVGPAGRLALLAGGAMVAAAAFTAAAAVGASRDSQPRWT